MGSGSSVILAAVFLLVFSVKKRRAAVLAEEKERMLVSQMSTYCSDAPSLEEAKDLQTVMDRMPPEGKMSELDSILQEKPSEKKGAVICLLIAAFMVFGANVLDYGISICKAYFQFEASFDTIRYVALNFSSLMTEYDMWGGFITNLLIGYGLSVWSSHSLIGAILSYREP